ncbi:MAG: zinc ribbon domain-containing protein [Methanoregula sp.]|nr:zinc ribbon domain-containing protein [Methanoregula sp.]
MVQKFCTICGSALPEGMKFCESCGAAVESPVPSSPPSMSSPAPAMPVSPVPAGTLKGSPTPKIIAGIVIVLIILAVAAYIFVLPKMSGGSSSSSLPGSTGTPVTTSMTAVVTASTPMTSAITAAPTPTPDPFPNALLVKDGFPFGSGKVASEANVYRVWMNDSYQWHNDLDNNYYLEKAKSGNKFLFVFLNVYNKGDTRVWPPTSGNVKVYYNGVTYSPDQNHFLPDKSSDRKATAIEVKEVQYFSKLFGSEYVEDYGYSHGTQYAFLYPGKSNAIDGYVIFQVPTSLTPDKAYAQIEFNGNEAGVWKLG